MSILLNGELRLDWEPSTSEEGEFIRQDSQFRHWVTADGTAGQSGGDGFKAEAGRYHLYISHACPWAHRTLIFRKLKKLEDLISVSVVSPDMGPEGWKFGSFDGATEDHLNNCDFMYQVYQQARPDYSGIVTVPVLYDKQQQTIVNNESSEIIRMFNTAFNTLTGDTADYYPENLRSDIDKINEFIYHNINNGVYRTGFATSQQAYEKAFDNLFSALDEVESRLGQQRYLTGTQITEADWRLFTTLVRFDPVYVGHFKCNRQRIVDYPNLSNYLRDLYQQPGIAETVFMDHIKRHYYWSHPTINPSRIVPKGPAIDYGLPHDRKRFD
ncbi:MAG: glutathione S-transferase family protein [Gammaproteobacteria bacterium]|nr:glutathione S-transferase family protein [Gammaproteobacteria bacterium]